MEIYVHVRGTILPMILSQEKCAPTSWGDLCQDVVQNLLMAKDSRLILKILTEICPKERLTHYLIRYGGGNASIIHVDWSSTDIIPPLIAYIDLHMILKQRVRESLQRLAQPHLPVQPMGVPFPAALLHVDLCASVASSTALLLPYNEDQMSVLNLKEDEQFPGCVDTFSIVPADGHHDLLQAAVCVPQASSAAAVITAGTTVSAGEKRKAISTTASMKEEVMSSKKKKKKNKGELQSIIVDPNFYQKYPGALNAGFKVLDYLYLHSSHAPWIEGAGLLLAAESCYGNNAKMNLQRKHYLRQSFGKTDSSAIPADGNTRVCFVYGAGHRSRTFGTVEEQIAYREWTEEMQIIADAIRKELVKRFSADKGVDVNVHLNELEVISFYDGKKITFHRDQTYSAEGKFCSNNCQKQHTCTCIFVLGDERVLEFQLFWGKNKSEVNHPEALNMIRLTNGALFFLHPEDEEDRLRQIFKMKE